MLSKTRFHCLNCEGEIYKDMPEYEYGQMITCPHCGELFNIYGIFNSFYEEIPICKKIVDVTTHYIGYDFKVETDNSDYKDKIDYFFKDINISKIYPDIIFDTVLYGDSFLEVIDRESKKIGKLDLKNIEMVSGFHREPPAQGYYSYIEKIIEYNKQDDTHRELKNEDFIHFIGEHHTGDSSRGF